MALFQHIFVLYYNSDPTTESFNLFLQGYVEQVRLAEATVPERKRKGLSGAGCPAGNSRAQQHHVIRQARSVGDGR
jgi:hypothetical protein